MPSLLQVLHDATLRGAIEIVLEPDRPPQARGPEQVEAIATVLSEGELYDALGSVLKPEQQAELAVGNVVEFHLFDGSAKWHLVAEPGGEGVIVRGRSGESNGSPVAEVGAPLDLPPLRRGEPDRNQAVPRAPGPLLAKKARDTAWDLPPVTGSHPLPKPTPRSNPALGSAPTEAGLPSWFESGSAAAPAVARRPPPVPASKVEAESVDFALLRRPPTGEPPAMLDDAVEVGNGLRPMRADDPFIPLARALEAGSICLVRGHGIGERLGRHYGSYALILERREIDALRGEQNIATFVVRIEDPSEVLGWALRRAEEGARVIIEIGARTAAGARRSLLGTNAGPAAAAWLDALTVQWLAEQDGRWVLEKIG